MIFLDTQAGRYNLSMATFTALICLPFGVICSVKGMVLCGDDFGYHLLGANKLFNR